MSQPARIESALGQLSLTYQEFVGITADELRKHWREKIKKSHPDLPENRSKSIDPAAVNAAYDTLRQNLAERARLNESAVSPDNVTRYDRASIAPPWQPDKHATSHRIHAESYRDQNFIKKRLWELSNQSDEIYTIDAFGRNAFEGRTRVYGNKNVFDEMAKAMLIWNANGSDIKLTRAVFVSSSNQDKSLYLIYADGKSLARNPIPLQYNAKASSPSDDKTFLTQLPIILDHIQQMLAGQDVAKAG